MLSIRIESVVTLGVILFLGAGFVLAVSARFSGADNNADLLARQLGGVYLGGGGVVIQDDPNACAPAALKMILDRFGKETTLAELKTRAGGARGWWSMLTMKEIALEFGISAGGWRLDLPGLAQSSFPLILFVENRHFVVADSVDQNGYVFLRDPAIGRLKMRTIALLKIWKGESMIFEEDTTQTKEPMNEKTNEVLAGLSIANEGKAPGRPPGGEPRSRLMNGPQRAH